MDLMQLGEDLRPDGRKAVDTGGSRVHGLFNPKAPGYEIDYCADSDPALGSGLRLA